MIYTKATFWEAYIHYVCWKPQEWDEAIFLMVVLTRIGFLHVKIMTQMSKLKFKFVLEWCSQCTCAYVSTKQDERSVQDMPSYCQFIQGKMEAYTIVINMVISYYLQLVVVYWYAILPPFLKRFP